MAEIDYNAKLDALNQSINDFKQYFVDRHNAQNEAAAAKAILDAEALEAEKVAEQELEQQQAAELEAQKTLEAEEKAADLQFKEELLSSLETLNTNINVMNEKTVTTEDFSDYQTQNVQLLETIGEKLGVTQFENEVATAGYYADIGLIILIFGLVPFYVIYRFVKPFGGLISKII